LLWVSSLMRVRFGWNAGAAESPEPLDCGEKMFIVFVGAVKLVCWFRLE